MSAVDQFSPSDQVSQESAGAVPPIGTLLGGRYTITCRLAEGTFGHTYLAKDVHLPHYPDCVVKQLKPQTSERSMQMARRMFETEARVLYDLGKHDQIPQLLAHFEQEGEFFLVQEFVDGHAISDELSPQHPWKEEQVVPLLEEIFQVLRFVHGKKVIHRDLKPGNLLRRKRDGKIVLIDFGAVKEVTTRFLSPKPGSTDYTIAIGTVGYIPKEQLGGRPRFSSDVFAVGMLAIQALTGVHPNAFEEDSDTAEMRWREHLLSPIHPQLADILDQMVRYDFRDRFADAEEALRAIQSLPESLRSLGSHSWRSPCTRIEPESLPPTQSFEEEEESPSSPVSLTAAEPPSFPEASPEASLLKTSASQTSVSAASVPASPASTSDGPPEPSPGETDELPATAVASVTAVSPATAVRESAPQSSPSSPPRATSPSAFPRQVQSRKTRLSYRRYSAAQSSGAIATLQNWIVQSWRLLLLVGSASLGLMVMRGIALSAGGGAPSVPSLQSFHTSLLSEANRVLQTVQVAEEPVPAKIQATQYLVEADEARAQQRYEIALERYQAALMVDTDLAEAHWGKCATYLDQGQPEAAMEACHDAIAINPGHAPSWWSLATAQEQIGLHEESAKARARALEIDENVADEVMPGLLQEPTQAETPSVESDTTPAE